MGGSPGTPSTRPGKRSTRTRNRKQRGTPGFSTPGFALNCTVNQTLTASTYHDIDASGYVTSTNGTVLRPTSVCVRAASSAPASLRVVAQTSSNGGDWVDVYSTATTIVGATCQLYRCRAPKATDFKTYARWRFISNGSPVVAGYVTFGVRDPLSA